MLLGHVLPKEIVALVWEFVVGDYQENRARMVHELKMACVAIAIKEMREHAEEQDIEDSIVGVLQQWQHETSTAWDEGDGPAYLYHSYKWYMTTRKKLMTRRGRIEYAQKQIARLKEALEKAVAEGDVVAVAVTAQQIQNWMTWPSRMDQ